GACHDTGYNSPALLIGIRHGPNDRCQPHRRTRPAEASLWLREQGAALVGIDSLDIDGSADLGRLAHSILLRAEIPIVEHLTGLAALPGAGFRFFAVP